MASIAPNLADPPAPPTHRNARQAGALAGVSDDTERHKLLQDVWELREIIRHAHECCVCALKHRFSDSK